MIVKMKEVTLFVPASRADASLDILGQLGVIDIKHINTCDNDTTANILEKINKADKAIDILSSIKTKGIIINNKYEFNDIVKTISNILNSGEIIKLCNEIIDSLEKKEQWYKLFGTNTNVKEIATLEKEGIYIKTYIASKNTVNLIPQDKVVKLLPEQGGLIPVVLVSRDKEANLSLEKVDIPNQSYQQIQQAIIRKKRQITEVNNYLYQAVNYIHVIKEYREFLTDRLQFERVYNGMGDIENKVVYLRGYAPVESIPKIEKTVKQHNWALHVQEPENIAEVPVYIKNPRWISVINPLLNFVGITPGYKEVDVSIYFLFAFTLFFAMLIGDAGYGLLFGGLTFIFRKSIEKQFRQLMYVLSFATIIWGVITGTYFGSEAIAAIPVLNSLIIPQMSSFGGSVPFMMHFSFLIGAIHLTVAHGVRFFNYINSLIALSEIGWIGLVWGLFYVVEFLVIGIPMPIWGTWLFIIGGALVVLFSANDKNFFKSMLISIGNLPLSVINGFSDVVSYVRLFAVGLATVVVASSFNSMVIPADGDMGFIDYIVAAIALFLGHSLNIVLALMAVMVHGIRLNMLEFAGHLGIQFSGEEYRPFKLKAIKLKSQNK
ncbi:MAG: hypothetical protein SNJ71_04260 [Bacteroidales bacterium]